MKKINFFSPSKLQQKKWFLIIIMITIGISSIMSQVAQPIQNFNNHPRAFTQRKSFWFEGNLNGTLVKNDSGQAKLQYQLDYQYRRFADANYIKGGHPLNIFQNIYAVVVRPWFHYWVVPGKLRLSTSPLGYWAAWTPPSEGAVVFNHEVRSSYQMTLFSSIGRFDFQQRYRYEFRWVGHNQTALNQGTNQFGDVFSSQDVYGSKSNKSRLRYMFKTTYNITKNKNKYIAVWDEVFIGMGANVSNTKILDQNRLIALYGQKFNEGKYPIKLEIGFTWQCQPKYNLNVPPTQTASYGSYMKNNWENNLALQVYLIFDEFHKFKKKEVKKA